MRRISLIAVSMIVSGACLMGTAAGQDNSVFSFASDPDSTEVASNDAEGGDEAEGEESYDSYASWPSNGKSLVQRKALFRAQQRELRVAARKWYGFTASRPPVQGNPYYASAYAPSLWTVGVYGQQSLYGPFGWYFPRRSVSADRWNPLAYAAMVR